ncbi:MAG: type ISP restriction/modification enzyme [Acidimicrobiia bacterium]
MAELDGDLDRAGRRLRPKDGNFIAVLGDFLNWKPTPQHDLSELVRISAGLCHLLRDEVTDTLQRERRGDTAALFTDHLADWQEWLFPDLTDDEFADAYAQTITFGLMLARREGVIFEGHEIPDIGEKLAKQHLLVGRALSILTARPDRGASIEERSIVLQTMRRVIGASDWTNWPAAGTYHRLYEQFLESYDPVIRRQTGAYYTPPEVSDFMTRFVDEVLQNKLNVRRGLADKDVMILDPAMGTGTFLQSVVDSVAATLSEERDDVPASLRELLKRLIGFERQIGPFAVAELKLDQALESHQAEAKGEDFRLYVADTLADPHKVPLPRRARMYAPLADSQREANRVKIDEPVMVVIGNPPYRTRAKHLGKWIVDQPVGHRSLLDDFRLPDHGKQEYKLHDLAIYFWRWALWKAFESTPEQPAGIVAFITTYAYLNGPGFAGMRRYIRQEADFGWIIDMSTEGHWSSVGTRVFPGVPHPVCIGIFARCSQPRRNTRAEIQYLAVSGKQENKFSKLKRIHVTSTAWQECPKGWTDPLRPVQDNSWTRYPLIDDLLPYTSLGVTCNRAWVHAPEAEILKNRWRILIRASPTEKRRLIKETDDRTIDKVISPFPGLLAGTTIKNEADILPRIEPISFRSFDQQYMIADQRVVDRFRSDLWTIHGPKQVWLVTHLRAPLTNGPAAVFTAHIPDTDCFKGHNGGRAIPLYRDTDNRIFNVTPKLILLLHSKLGLEVGGHELVAYIAGIVAHSGYTARFHTELQQPGVRIPLTTDPTLWCEAISIGKQIIWLHTFGERFYDGINGRPMKRPSAGRPGVVGSIASGQENIPESIEYEAPNRSILLGSARIEPVSPEVWAYEVSGMRVIKHWFNYRKRKPAGRRGGSDLDNITAESWTLEMTEQLRDLVAVLEGCVKLEAQQADLLGQIVNGPLITTADLTEAAILPPPKAARRIVEDDADETLFSREKG